MMKDDYVSYESLIKRGWALYDDFSIQMSTPIYSFRQDLKNREFIYSEIISGNKSLFLCPVSEYFELNNFQELCDIAGTIFNPSALGWKPDLSRVRPHLRIKSGKDFPFDYGPELLPLGILFSKNTTNNRTIDEEWEPSIMQMPKESKLVAF